MELQHTYPQVLYRSERSYGGDQTASPDKTMQRCGCGVVAATDVLLYLHRNHPGCQTEIFEGLTADAPLSAEKYEALTARLRQRFFPLIYPFGMNGLTLAVGLNRYFRRYNIALRARWGSGRRSFEAAAGYMLRQDIPVILSIGPNFPYLWRKHRETLYRVGPDGDPRRAAETKAHYVTATAMDEHWLRISSWGREYRLRREEYEEYIRLYSSKLVSNLVYIRKV